MPARPEIHCYKEGEPVGVFGELDALEAEDRKSLRITSELVQAAAKVCELCPHLGRCQENTQRFQDGKSMKGWHTPTVEDTPMVMGGYLLEIHETGERTAVEIPDQEAESAQKAFDEEDLEITREVIGVLNGSLGPEYMPRRIGAGVIRALLESGELSDEVAEVLERAVSGQADQLETAMFVRTIAPPQPVREPAPASEKVSVTAARKAPAQKPGTKKAPVAKPSPKPGGGSRGSSSRGRARTQDQPRPDEDIVRMYLQEIGRKKLLTKPEEVELSKLVLAGLKAQETLASADETLPPDEVRNLQRAVRRGAKAKDEFVQANLRLVVSIAKRYQSSGLPLLDLIQEGNLGLMHAVDKFDWQKGFKFSTYSTWWIRQAITRGIANTGREVRLPVHAGEELKRLRVAQTRLNQKLAREATVQELAADLKITVEKVLDILSYASEPISLSAGIGENGDTEFGELVADKNAISPEEAAIHAELPSAVDEMLRGLDERERRILVLRFGIDRGEPRTLEEVGEHFNLTRERIRQIEARAMSKLRHPVTTSSGIDMLY